jgi:hypothetical protein
MFVWIQKNWKPISIIGTSVAFAGALIGWHFVSQIPEARKDLLGLIVMSGVITGVTITSYLLMEQGWGRKISLLDRPLPILASFVFPMFAGTWSILWDIPDYLNKKECIARPTEGQPYLWRRSHCYTPEEWEIELCKKHPTYCD